MCGLSNGTIINDLEGHLLFETFQNLTGIFLKMCINYNV